MKVLLAVSLTLASLVNDVASQNGTMNQFPAQDVHKGLGHPGKLLFKLCSWFDPLRFYGDSRCLTYAAGSIEVKRKKWGGVCAGVNIENKSCFDSKRIRSLLIRSHFPINGEIYLCDNPLTCWFDDYTKIIVKRRFIGRGYCLGNFERTFEDDYVKVYHKHVNGLNGRVSRVAACRP